MTGAGEVGRLLDQAREYALERELGVELYPGADQGAQTVLTEVLELS